MDEKQFTALLKCFNEQQTRLLTEVLDRVSSKAASDTKLPQVIHQNIPPFEHFDSAKEKFKFYLDWFENYLRSKGISDDSPMRTSLLLNAIGSTHYNTLSALTAPKSIKEFNYNELVAALSQMLPPVQSDVVSQHYFLSTYQKEEQNIAAYVATLQRDLAECNFNTTCKCGKEVSIAEKFLRAQFIGGI
jgi:hypothetical protein